MKRIVSVSLGSSKRDFKSVAEYLGEEVELSRVGVDGDLGSYRQKLQELDGKVDAIGLGGIDLYLVAGGKRYAFREAKGLAGVVKKTPVVDGSGLKNTLERQTVRWLIEHGEVDFAGCNTLVVCAVDRFGMAEEIALADGKVVYGDLMFALGLPVPVRSWKFVKLLASVILPVVVQLPFKLFYPTGSKQEETHPRFGWAYSWADIVAGDFHMIRRSLPREPGSLDGKTILTNTTTTEDRELLRSLGARRLITTTQSFAGRSAGTNVLEAALVAVSGAGRSGLSASDYEQALARLGWAPEISNLQETGVKQ